MLLRVTRYHGCPPFSLQAIYATRRCGAPCGRSRAEGLLGADGRSRRDPLTGRRSRVVRGLSGTKREAEKALSELVVDVASGRTSTKGATLAELVDRWLLNVGGSVSPRTRAEYRRLATHRIVPALGTIKVDKLTAEHPDRLSMARSGECPRPATVRQVHAVISSALSQAVRWEWGRERRGSSEAPGEPR